MDRCFFDMYIKNNMLELPLEFSREKKKNIFKDLTNKTVRETIVKKNYKNLEKTVYENYLEMLDLNIGEFLFQLKTKKDNFYKHFLNKHGDLVYSNFSLLNCDQQKLKGIYFFYVKGKLQYIGRCRDSMGQRINRGYGHITPKNCYKDGQTTNCKMNAFVTKNKKKVKLFLYPMLDNKEIEQYELELIKLLNPNLNSTYAKKIKLTFFNNIKYSCSLVVSFIKKLIK